MSEDKFLKEIFKKYKSKTYALISLLQEVQDHFGFLSEEIIRLISENLNIPIAKIYGIITFYSQFKLNPVGKYVVQVCLGTACHVKGSAEILKHFETKLGIKAGQSTPDMKITLETINCIGACSLSPAIAINKKVYGHLDTDIVDSLIRKMQENRL